MPLAAKGKVYQLHKAEYTRDFNLNPQKVMYNKQSFAY